MLQGVLPYKYAEDGNGMGMMGLPVYLDLAHVTGLSALQQSWQWQGALLFRQVWRECRLVVDDDLGSKS